MSLFDDITAKIANGIERFFEDDSQETEGEVQEATESVSEESVVTNEEWIWIEGFKGTDKNMCCNGYQYTMNELHTMPEDAEIVECESGFHLCLRMHDVHKYYGIHSDHRFFKVLALVRKEDYENYGCRREVTYTPHFSHSYISSNKLVAKAIKFVYELTTDEILEPYIDLDKWTEENKKLALSVGVDNARKIIRTTELVGLGYSQAFTDYIMSIGAYDVAVAVGSQSDLSMDMKALMIVEHMRMNTRKR